MSLQSITDLIVHTKNVTPQGPVFARSFEQGTENPRIENSVITPVAMHPEGSNLIEAFLCLMVFALRGYSCLLFDLTLSAMVENHCWHFLFLIYVKSWVSLMNTKALHLFCDNSFLVLLCIKVYYFLLDMKHDRDKKWASLPEEISLKVQPYWP